MAGRTHIGAVWMLAVAGCMASGGQESGSAPILPSITGLSTDAAAVGDRIDIRGQGLVAPDEGWVDVTFIGTFTPHDGSAPQPVELTIPLQHNRLGELTWDSFGAYRVPFSESGDQTGTFDGQVFATNQYYDGRSVEQPTPTWLDLRFEVLPSVVVLDFRAIGEGWVADCRFPSAQPLNLVPYAMRVKAIGFEPYEFRYEISEGLIVDGAITDDITSIRVVADSVEHSILTQWAPVPPNVDGYRASVAVTATGADGIPRQVVYPIMVRRPMQVYFRGPMQIAELYEPEPVSGCIPGGPASVESTYSETTSETRTRTIQNTIERGFERAYGEQHEETWGSAETAGESSTASREVSMTDTRSSGYDESTTDAFSRTDGRTRVSRVNFSQRDSEEWGWMIQDETVEDFTREIGGGTTVGGQAGVPFVANGSVEVNVQGKAGWLDGTRRREGESGERGTETGVERGSEEGSSVQEQRARSRQNGFHWDISQGYAEANGFSQSQSFSQTRSFGEAVSHSETLAERESQAASELYSVSTTQSEALSTRAWVWAGKFGVWYRQTTRLVRYGSVVAYDLCGNGSEVGELVLDDWAWAPDLGLGDECPPPSNLPAAECRIPPCNGY